MKKIICFAMLSIACLGAFSQDSNTMYMKNDTSGAALNNGKMKNYFTMVNGRIQIVKDGVSSPLAADQTLKDGTTIKTDGTILMKNGQSKMLKEGEKVYMDGKMGLKMKGMKDDNMMNKKDSTQ